MKRFTICILLILAAAIAGISQNPRNVLVYNLTDTDCGPCSCMDSIIRCCMLPTYPKTILVALHSPMFNSGFREYQGNEVFGYFHSQYEPSGFIDGLGYDTPFANLKTAVGQRYAESPNAPVQINMDSKTWDAGSRNVSFTLTMKNLETEIQEPCWFNIFVTEDNLIHPHRIWTGCATPTQPAPPLKMDFINDHVIRKLEYLAKGDSLIGPTWPSQQTITRTFNVHIDTGWVEGNCHVVFAVYKKNDSLYKAAVQQAITQSVTGGVGMEEKTTASSGITRVYPNPASDWVNIHLSVGHPGNCTLDIVDLSGKTVETVFEKQLETGVYNVEYDTKGLSRGQYILRLRSGSGESVKGMVIHR